MSEPHILNARANKSLGQHFLFDPDILNRTALCTGPVEGRTVIEVGPGPGGLTAALLRNGAKKVIAVEMDPRFAENLRSWKECKEGRLSVVGGDGLTLDYEKLVEGESLPVKIIANLPYNVGTPMLVNWIKSKSWRGEMGLMFQHEVAIRVCAQPEDKHYGRLAVLSQAVANTHIAFTLPPGAFKPPPKVDSSVAVLMPLADEEKYPHLGALEKVTAAAFGQRRKMLRAALKSLAKTKNLDATEWLEKCDIDPTRRAETLTQHEFRALTDGFLLG
ncbi:16S rRNA (adenine(1518)-N(6)/adenine(1519)-N(6))-dimethyltransferase RsmA [Hirschia litorea]|uniref:Ribosomal RNA small subunit methyltransferase A n=1 Tax=Hirschia litorea TaxID=1199156 RepID=A0ABW2IGT7_9PROT